MSTINQLTEENLQLHQYYQHSYLSENIPSWSPPPRRHRPSFLPRSPTFDRLIRNAATSHMHPSSFLRNLRRNSDNGIGLATTQPQCGISLDPDMYSQPNSLHSSLSCHATSVNTGTGPPQTPPCPEVNYVMSFQLRSDVISATSPDVVRVLSLPSTTTFHNLHKALRIAFGWQDKYSYSFTVFSETQDRRNSVKSGDGMSISFLGNGPRKYLCRIYDPKLPDEVMRADSSIERRRWRRENLADKVPVFHVLEDRSLAEETLEYTHINSNSTCFPLYITLEGRELRPPNRESVLNLNPSITNGICCLSGSGPTFPQEPELPTLRKTFPMASPTIAELEPGDDAKPPAARSLELSPTSEPESLEGAGESRPLACRKTFPVINPTREEVSRNDDARELTMRYLEFSRASDMSHIELEVERRWSAVEVNARLEATGL
ncbi:hypothetical protein BCR34DRAFT_615172 [Clohesyomyces aquaticus]|uniref:Plasmid pRiA4b Orf3-like domain-containing protein n=1 Tax=Clohesyomyces aquaticus TaxID=1231657 RepID=A0A1Y1ZJS7_9PLEO|nr:hypothetical protein BCR34DRAFT_615172 [Clohesyomyces aquaticus]